MDGAAEILVIILSVFLAIFLGLSIVLAIILIKLTVQIRAVTKSAQKAANDVGATFSNISKATSGIALLGIVKSLFKVIIKSKRR